MEFTPSKRRKTSPNTAITVSASNGNNAIVRHGPRLSAQRSSYMSPTKASLARFNQNLLQRSGSAEPRKPASRPSSLRRATTEERATGIVEEDPVGNSRPTLAHSTRLQNGLAGGDERDPASDVEETPSKLPRAAAGPGSRSVREIDQDTNTPTARRRANASGFVEQVEDGEPSLPSTPSQLGLEAPPEKPRGLLFHTPSRRASRRSRSHLKSSPLKRSNADQKSQPASQEHVLSQLGPRTFIEGTPRPVDQDPSKESYGHDRTLQRLEARLRVLQEELTSDTMGSKWLGKPSLWSKRVAKKRKQLGKDAREYMRQQHQTDGAETDLLYNESVINDRRPKPTTTPIRTSSGLMKCLPFSKSSVVLTRASQGDLSDMHSEAPFVTRVHSSTLHFSTSEGLHIEQAVTLTTRDEAVIAEAQLSIDPASQLISKMSHLRLVPWATKELLPWLSDNTNRKPLSAIGNAVGGYAELATTRSSCWSQCAMRFPQLTDSNPTSVPIPKDLGAQTFRLFKSPVNLTVHWRLSLSKDGSIISAIELEPDFPPAWHRLDNEGELDMLDKAFRGLSKGKGITQAVFTLVDILFPP